MPCAVSGYGAISLLPGNAQGNLSSAILRAAGHSRVRRDRICCCHSRRLNAGDIDAGSGESFGQDTCAVLRELLQRILIAPIVRVRLNRDLIIRIIRKQRSDLVSDPPKTIQARRL